MRHYDVQYKIKPEKSAYIATRIWRVITSDVIRAAQLCVSRFPACTVISVNDKGQIDYVDSERHERLTTPLTDGTRGLTNDQR